MSRLSPLLDGLDSDLDEYGFGANFVPDLELPEPVASAAEPDSDGLPTLDSWRDRINRLDSDDLQKIGAELASTVCDSDDDFNDSGLGTCAHSQSSDDKEALEEQKVQSTVDQRPVGGGRMRQPKIIFEARQAGLFPAVVAREQEKPVAKSKPRPKPRSVEDDMGKPADLYNFLMSFGPK